jgi:hypothetical protein
MILNASFVCLQAFSPHRESPNLDPKEGALIFEVVLSQAPQPPTSVILELCFFQVYFEFTLNVNKFG